MSDREYFDYKIPNEWKQKIDKNFIKQMMYELHMIYGLNLDSPYLEDSPVSNVAGTSGWNVSLGNTCIKTNNYDLFKYYQNLPWYESDLFDEEIEQLFIDYKFIINGDMGDIIAEKTCFSKDEIAGCYTCGHWFPQEFITTNEYGEPICLHCLEQAKSENKHANSYYQESIKKNEEFLQKIKK